MTSEADAAIGVPTSAQIHGLIEALPELPGPWARLAGTDPGLLSQGNPRAHAALRAAFAHNHAALLGELARIGMPRVLAALDGREGDEELTDFAAAVGQVLGAEGAPLFLTAVASGDSPFAAEVAGRLAELRDAALRAATATNWPGSDGGAAPAAGTSMSDPSLIDSPLADDGAPTEVDTVAEAETLAGAGTVAEADTVPGAETLTGAGTVGEAGTVARAETLAGVGTVAGADALAGTETLAETGTVGEVGTMPGAETPAGADALAGVGTIGETGTVPGAGTLAGADMGAGAGTSAGARTAAPAELTDLIARTAELIELGVTLVDRLRDAADSVAAGFPATSVGRELTAWSAAVEEHLADAAPVAVASDLVTLSMHLAETAAREAAEREAQRERERFEKDTLRAARVLHEQGLDNLIPVILRAVGFAEPDDWRAALALDTSPAPDESAPATLTEAPVTVTDPVPEPVAPAEPEAAIVQPETAEPEAAEPEAAESDAGLPWSAEEAGLAWSAQEEADRPGSAEEGAGFPWFAQDVPESAAGSSVAVVSELAGLPEGDGGAEPAERAESVAAPTADVESAAGPEPAIDLAPAAVDPTAGSDADLPWSVGEAADLPGWAQVGADLPGWAEAGAGLPWSVEEGADLPEAVEEGAGRPWSVQEGADLQTLELVLAGLDSIVVAEPTAEPTTMAPAPEQDDEALAWPSLDEVQFPWDGLPSLIATLLLAGRDALAVCVAEAAHESATRQRLLRFFCAAFSCSPAALELHMPELSPADTEVKELTVDECRLLLATVLRVGLSVGYSPVDLPSLIDRAELGASQIQAVVAAASEVVRRDYRREIGAAVMRRADVGPSWAAFGGRASALLETQSRGKLPLQRATNVLRHIAAPDEPVGRALILVTELSELGIGAANTEAQAEKWAHLEHTVATLSTPAGRARLITSVDVAVSRGSQLRNRIVGTAMQRLDGTLQETAKLIADFLAERTAVRQASAEADLRGAEALPLALGELVDVEEPRTAGDAGLRRFTDWLRGGAHQAAGASVDQLLDAELTPLYEIPRDASGAPVRVPTPAEARELLRGRDLRRVLGGYLRVGNIAAARALVAAADRADQAAFDDEVQTGAQAARQRYNQALASVHSTAGRLRAMLDDAAARDLMVTAEEPAPEDGRFDVATAKLLTAVKSGEERLRGYREELRARVRRCNCDEADRQRILSLIDQQQDEVLAVEFLTSAEAGQPLPEADAEGSDDFAAFFPAMVDVAVAAAQRHEDAVTAVRAAAGATGAPANQQFAHGLDAWRELKANKRSVPGDTFRVRVAHVLRMIGLVPRDLGWLRELSRTQRSGYATFQVRAAPIEGSRGSYVPSLGTQANGDYDLTLVWDKVTSTRLLDFVDERRRTRANIIVYFNTLDPGQRLQLRRSTRHSGGKGFSPLVIDDAVVGWLTTLAEPGWQSTQRVTLPFTTVNPYSPFAGGEVPDEVFVGREQEQAEIESPTGSMFVYGGRQLGKSALLRRVERMFTDPPPARDGGWQARRGRVAVYLDLKAASIGEGREPSALWQVLVERLVALQVLPKDAGRITTPERVSRQISAWLEADDGNHLLLLLDEADNFLTKDCLAGASGGGTEFPNLQRLKGLMGTSGRRFKAVFAGLHQVQRFHDIPNTPVAHGGDDILIGQLSTKAAYDLVVDPMKALGYEFGSEEHVWRLLLFANYQASLVQIACDALVTEMSREELPSGGGRIRIDAADVEAIIGKREVRNLIVQRFWWTINLDPRYRVIALVVAARSLDGDLGETFTPEDLHEFCELYWEAGFSRAQLSGTEFRRYLEEMVGLGVLHRQDDEYGLRSPNILSLLGTRQWIDQALNDAPRELEVPDEYNPSTSRRIMEKKSTELWAPRSPLTDRDIANLLGLDGQRHEHGRVQVVTGSPALAIGRAASVISDVAEEQQIRCEIRRADELISTPRRGSHVVVDLSDSATAARDLPDVYMRLGEFAGVGATIIVGPDCVPVRLEGIDPRDVTPVKRWSAEGLRSWHDTPFTTPGMRARLYRVTSGWPLLVERTMREITSGKSPDDALGLILARLANRDFAREYLADCGIDLSLAIRWAAEFGVDGDDGLAEAFPATFGELATEFGADVAHVVERLQVLDVVEDTPSGWVLDRAVFAAARALAE